MKKFLSLALATLMCVAAFAAFSIGTSAAEQTYTKVTTAPTDWSGTYLIVYDGVYDNNDVSICLDASLSTIDAEGNHKSVTISDGTITGDYSAYTFVIETMEGGYSVKTSTGKYIGNEYKNGEKQNKLVTADTPILNTITLGEDGSVSLTSAETVLRFNNATTKGNNRFRYYKSNQQPVSLYKLTSGTVTPSPVDPDPVPTEKVVASTSKVVLFNAANSFAVTATFDDAGKKLTGATATANEDGTLTVPGNDHAVWTRTIYTDDTFTLATADGKYLTSAPTGNGVSLVTTPTEYSYWTIEDETGYIKNVAAIYNGGAQYLEYYYGFTTFGAPYEGKEAAYIFTVYDDAKVNPSTKVPTGDATAVIAVLAVVALFGTAVIVKKVHD